VAVAIASDDHRNASEAHRDEVAGGDDLTGRHDRCRAPAIAFSSLRWRESDVYTLVGSVVAGAVAGGEPSRTSCSRSSPSSSSR
jgi:hypothetical protein